MAVYAFVTTYIRLNIILMYVINAFLLMHACMIGLSIELSKNTAVNEEPVQREACEVGAQSKRGTSNMWT